MKLGAGPYLIELLSRKYCSASCEPARGNLVGNLFLLSIVVSVLGIFVSLAAVGNRSQIINLTNYYLKSYSV